MKEVSNQKKPIRNTRRFAPNSWPLLPCDGCKHCVDRYNNWFASAAKDVFGGHSCTSLEWDIDTLIDEGFPSPRHTFATLRKEIEQAVPESSIVMGTLFVERVSFHDRYLSTVRLLVSDLISPDDQFPDAHAFGVLHRPKPFDFSQKSFAKFFERVSCLTEVADSVELRELCEDCHMAENGGNDDGHLLRRLSPYQFMFRYNLEVDVAYCMSKVTP